MLYNVVQDDKAIAVVWNRFVAGAIDRKRIKCIHRGNVFFIVEILSDIRAVRPQKYGIGLEVVFGSGLQEISIVPAGLFFCHKAPALLASCADTKATALEERLSPGTPRSYVQRLLSRQQLLLL